MLDSRVAVPAQFPVDFEAVCNRYGLSDAERVEAKEAARRDIVAAIECFASLAKERVE